MGKKHFLILSLFVGCALLTICTNSKNENSAVYKTDVYVSGTDGYHTYRIPAVILTQQGTLLAFCEGRKDNRRDHGDVDLLVKRSSDNGKTWSSQQIVHEEGDTAKITIGNPCPVVDKTDGTIYLLFCRDNVDVFVTKSIDDGLTWSEPRNITKDVSKSDWQWYATGPGIGIQLQQEKYKGRLVIPCDHRNNEKGKSDEKKYGNGSHVIYSDDHGKTWQLSDVIQPGANECQVVELADGRLLLNMRMQTFRKGYRGIAYSEDGGETWMDFKHDKNLPGPRCQASFIRYTMENGSEKNRLLFSNPLPPEIPSEKRGRRVNLTVSLSYDEGKSCPIKKSLQQGPSAYSCLVVLPDGNIGCLYENGEKSANEKIMFAKFSLEWLTDGQYQM